jgi:hypothetical protein
VFDALSQLNAWGHLPEYWPPTWHNTNPRVAAGHGDRRDNFRVNPRLKRSEAGRASRPNSPRQVQYADREHGFLA